MINWTIVFCFPAGTSYIYIWSHYLFTTSKITVEIKQNKKKKIGSKITLCDPFTK